MRFLALLLAALAALGSASAAQAQLSFQLRTGNSTNNSQSMPFDSNQCATPRGPRAMYVGGVITNNGGATATNIVASISGLSGNFALAGGQAAAQTIGSLAPGASTGVYWFVSYGCTQATVSPIVTITSSLGSASTTLSLATRSAISANAGGQVVGSQIGNGAVVGQTLWFDASYSFGGSEVNDEFFLQPAGGTAFNAGCFRLVGSEIRASTIGVIAVGRRDQLYFLQSAKQSGTGYTVTVRYSFEYLCANTSTTARPYAVQTSGADNIKYTGNFDGSGSVSLSFSAATNPFTISKTADSPTAVAGARATVKYTVTITNPSAFASRISQIVDTLPAGANFSAIDPASDVTAANSSSVPASGASGSLAFVGIQDQSYAIAAGGTVKLIYTVLMPAAAGSYVNSAQGRFGTASTPTASATFTVITPAPLTVVKSSQASRDPLNGTTNPKLIPGGRAAYTIAVANPNAFTVTADTIVLTDPTPAALKLFVGNISGNSGGPVLFQNGSTASGLTFSFANLASTTDDVDFSNDGGATWTYAPTADPDGTDGAVTHIRIRPKGAMAANSSFSLVLGYVVK
jgi:uncharacterized repeat protein (TIGR01451 family)